MTDDRAETAKAYGLVFSDRPETQTVLDDLVNWASAIADPLTKAGATLAIHRIYSQRSWVRRANKKKGA